MDIKGDTRSLDYSSYGRYLGPKVGIWEPLWALSIYHIPAWTLQQVVIGFDQSARANMPLGCRGDCLCEAAVWVGGDFRV